MAALGVAAYGHVLRTGQISMEGIKDPSLKEARLGEALKQIKQARSNQLRIRSPSN